MGQVEDGIGTAHVGVARGRFPTRPDADRSRPASWDTDRPRCQGAGIPFAGLVFGEGYGGPVPFRTALSVGGQQLGGEVPVNRAARTTPAGVSPRADAVPPATAAERGRAFRLARRAPPQVWRAVSRPVAVDGRTGTVVAAVNAPTAEVTDGVTNATSVPWSQILAVAFRRATVEHLFRVARTAAGRTHSAGRPYVGVVRHRIPRSVVRGFVSVRTDRLRGGETRG